MKESIVIDTDTMPGIRPAWARFAIIRRELLAAWVALQASGWAEQHYANDAGRAEERDADVMKWLAAIGSTSTRP